MGQNSHQASCFSASEDSHWFMICLLGAIWENRSSWLLVIELSLVDKQYL